MNYCGQIVLFLALVSLSQQKPAISLQNGFACAVPALAQSDYCLGRAQVVDILRGIDYNAFRPSFTPNFGELATFLANINAVEPQTPSIADVVVSPEEPALSVIEEAPADQVVLTADQLDLEDPGEPESTLVNNLLSSGNGLSVLSILAPSVIEEAPADTVFTDPVVVAADQINVPDPNEPASDTTLAVIDNLLNNEQGVLRGLGLGK